MLMRVLGSLKDLEMVIASRGLRGSAFLRYIQTIATDFAGQPRLQFVLDICVERSSTSSRCASSTAGSHSRLSSGVVSTAFHGSNDTGSSTASTSRTILYTSSLPLDLVLRCTTTSESSGAALVNRPLPFFGVDAEPSVELDMRLHSFEGEVRSCRK